MSADSGCTTRRAGIAAAAMIRSGGHVADCRSHASDSPMTNTNECSVCCALVTRDRRCGSHGTQRKWSVRSTTTPIPNSPTPGSMRSAATSPIRPCRSTFATSGAPSRSGRLRSPRGIARMSRTGRPKRSTTWPSGSSGYPFTGPLRPVLGWSATSGSGRVRLGLRVGLEVGNASRTSRTLRREGVEFVGGPSGDTPGPVGKFWRSTPPTRCPRRSVRGQRVD